MSINVGFFGAGLDSGEGVDLTAGAGTMTFGASLPSPSPSLAVAGPLLGCNDCNGALPYGIGLWVWPNLT